MVPHILAPGRRARGLFPHCLLTLQIIGQLLTRSNRMFFQRLPVSSSYTAVLMPQAKPAKPVTAAAPKPQTIGTSFATIEKEGFV